MHVKMKPKAPGSQVLLQILALSLLTSQQHVLSAPTETDTSSLPPSFYSKLYANSSDKQCQLLPKFVNYSDTNDESFISIKLNSMCNINASNASSTSLAQPTESHTRLCEALSSLFPMLCESSIKFTNSSEIDTKIAVNQTVVQDLGVVCKNLTKAAQRAGKRNKSLTLPWKGVASSNRQLKCKEDCKNIPIPGVAAEENHYVNPACLLLLRGYQTYLKASIPSSEIESTSTSPQDQDETRTEAAIEKIPRKKKKNVPFDRQSLKSSSAVLNFENPSNHTKIKDQDGRQNQNQTDQDQRKSSVPPEEPKVAALADGLSLPNTSSKTDISAGRARGREGVTESSDTLLGRTEDKHVESPKNQTIDGSSSLQANQKTNKTSSNSISTSNTSVGETLPIGGNLNDQNEEGMPKAKSSSVSTSSSTAASVDAGNGPSDLPIPLPPSKDGDASKKKTSTISPGNANDEPQSVVGGLQKDKDTEPSLVVSKTIKPQSPPKKVNSLNNEDIDKKDQIQKPISSNKDTNSDKGDGDTDLGVEVDDDYNGGDDEEKKVDRRPNGKKDGDNDNDNDFAPDTQDFGYGTSAKTANKGRNRFGDGDALQFENHGTTINVSLNESEESGFFSYFMFSVIVFGALYLVVHNKKKLLAYVVEGRRPRSRTRRTSSSSSQYRRLENNFD